MFKRNEGIIDRAVRVALGTVLIPVGLFLLGALQGSPLGLVAIGLGLFALITGFTGVCPLYIPFGISTLEIEKELMAKCSSMAAGCLLSRNTCADPMCRPRQQSGGETHE